MIIVTGGAGFIGSALIAELNNRGEENILVVDVVNHRRKERNLSPLKYRELVGIEHFRQRLGSRKYNKESIQGVFHLGACSDTSETSWNYLRENNVEYSKAIIQWCAECGIKCVYASSAAVYGDGEQGFSDDHESMEHMTPLNLYGRSKLDVDIWARDEGFLEKVVALRYFNVFGSNELHKGAMRSVVAKKFQEVREAGKISLFKSHRPDFKNGEQERDFVYIKDAVSMTLWLYEHPETGGVFNLGTGQSRTWNELASAMFAAMKKKPNIKYFEIPENLRGSYQYRTQADVSKLRAAGYNLSTTSLDDAVGEYILNYLIPDRHFRE